MDEMYEYKHLRNMKDGCTRIMHSVCAKGSTEIGVGDRRMRLRVLTVLNKRKNNLLG